VSEVVAFALPVHLRDGELPMGRLIASCSKHYTCVIDGLSMTWTTPTATATALCTATGAY
jgi:hypothetical protein